MHPIQYDLVIIGSGPAGQKGAIAAAKLGKRVAMVARTQRRLARAALVHPDSPDCARRPDPVSAADCDCHFRRLWLTSVPRQPPCRKWPFLLMRESTTASWLTQRIVAAGPEERDVKPDNMVYSE